MKEKYLQVFTATESKSDAEMIARLTVEKRLAACAQITGPIESTYWWKGENESAKEWGCTMKTTAARYPELEEVVREIHPYENPEIIATPIIQGSKKYLDWIEEETAK